MYRDGHLLVPDGPGLGIEWMRRSEEIRLREIRAEGCPDDGACPRLAILGAGNGGCAAAADLGRRGFDVRLWSRSPERLAPLRERGGVEYTGVLGEGFTPLAVITGDPAEAMDGAELVVLTVAGPRPRGGRRGRRAPPGGRAAPRRHARAHAHPASGRAPPPRRSGVRSSPRRARCPTSAGWPGPPRSGSRSRRGTSPSRRSPPGRPSARAHGWRPATRPSGPVPNVLDTVFLYGNAIHHPPATSCNAGRIEATGRRLLLTTTTGSARRSAGSSTGSMGSGARWRGPRRRTPPLRRPVLPYGLHNRGRARDSGLAYEAFHQSEPDRWIKAPPARPPFLDEDVPTAWCRWPSWPASPACRRRRWIT